MDWVDYIARWLHFVFGFFWIGGIFVFVVLIRPNLNRTPLPARAQFMRQFAPKMIHAFLGAAAVTIASGGVLLLNKVGSDGLRDLSSTLYGRFILLGALISLLMFTVGAGIILPTVRRLVVLLDEVLASPSHDTPPELPAELPVLQAKMARFAYMNTVLGLLVLLTMAGAGTTG